MNPKVNEVYLTKSGRLALIVCVPETPGYTDGLGMLWYDEHDCEMVVSPLLGRLKEKANFTVREFFGQCIIEPAFTTDLVS